MQVSDTEAGAFPSWTGREAGMAHALAVWVDTEGRVSYALRSVGAVDAVTGSAAPQAAAERAEAAAREGLASITAHPGFPAIHRAGGRA